jgi:ABC-type bacteriocin/lantibiotic exporter with double-glycine peptidase domain
MSEPEMGQSTGGAAASAHAVTFGASGGLRVDSGVVNVFAVDATGRRWPLVTVTGPMTLVGSVSDAISMVAEGHLDTVMRAVDEDPSPGDLEPWRQALVAHEASLSNHLPEGPDAAAIRSALATYSSALVAEGRATQDELLANLQAVNARIDSMASVRMQRHIAEPQAALKTIDEFPSISEAINVLRLVGTHRGFSVVEPRHVGSLDTEEALAASIRASQLRSRAVSLTDGWTSNGTEALVGFLDNGADAWTPVALIPGGRGYSYRTSTDPHGVKVVEGTTPLRPVALEVYPSLPKDRPATLLDMGRLALRGTWRTTTAIILCSLAVALVGLAAPAFTNSVLGVFVPEGSVRDIVAVGIALVLLAFAAGAFVVVQNFATSRLTQLAQLRVESAIWDRTLTLPLRFFRQYSSGDLAYRITAVDNLKQLLSSQTVTSIFAAMFSLVNFYLLFQYNTMLAITALIIITITAAMMVWLVRRMSTLIRHANTSQQDASAWFVQLVTGISKIRVAGAERRFTDISLLKQADLIANQAAQTLLTGRLQSFLALVVAGSTLLFFLIVGYSTWGPSGPEITSSTYIAFSTAFGTMLGAIVGLSAAVPALAAAGPTVDLVRPILDSVQDQDPHAESLSELRGSYEFHDVSFRYLPGMPLVLNGLTCSIEAGKVTAIVGASGSGKTTAMRLMSALEYPDSGEILIDGHDIRSVDAVDLRRHLGVVVQGGQLSNGSILDNIGGGVEISEDLAWICAQQACIADDILAMPMRMHTVVNALTLSGGQTQRILIARALARNPSVLLLDEATSALDNESQESIAEALRSLKATQIIIAQRLSTVQEASKILVMEHGRLVEQGSFDELMSQGGVFAALARRQLASS